MKPVEREMSIGVWREWNGWRANVCIQGQENKVKQWYEFPEDAFAAAKRLYTDLLWEESDADE